MSVTTLHPVGDGNYTEWESAIPGGGTHYDKVDDDPHDSTTTYLESDNGVGISGNITPFLRLSSTDNFGSLQSLTDDYTVYTQEVDRPGGGSWSKSDLDSVEMGVRTNVGIGDDHDDSFTTDSSSAGEIADIPDGDTIEKVEVRFVGKKAGTKTQTSYCTAVRLLVTHAPPIVTPNPVSCVISVIAPLVVLGSLILSPSATSFVAASVDPQVICGSISITPSAASVIVSSDIDPLIYPAPTGIEIDHQSSLATNVCEAPKFTAIFNGLNPSDVAGDVYVQVSEDDSFSSGGMIYDSDWLSLSSAGCDEGDRCEGIIYGTGYSAAPVLSSHPPDDKYYVRLKFRDDSSAAVESAWSGTSEFSGINRAWALPAYSARCKLYVDTDHAAIPAGWDLPFSFKTGERTVAATNGCFNEAVQASGGFQIEGYGSKLFYVYMSKQDPTQASGNYAIYIMESSDGGETWSTPVEIATAGTYYDTHYFPTLVIDKLGYIHVAYGSHNTPFKYTRSTNPADISSWWEPDTIADFTGTYPVGVLVPTKGGGQGRVYWFWRNTSAWLNTFIYSDDGGSTWSSAHNFIVDTDASKYRVYCYGYRYDPNTHRLHVGYTHNHSGDVEMGVWYIYSDLDEVDSLSGDYGFNIWHRANDDVAGYSSGASGDAVDYDESEAIVFGDDHMARTFIECLELDASGDPIVFWEQKIIPGAPTEETHLVCATWNGSTWDTHYISDQVNRMLRVRRSSIGLGCDKDNVIRAVMPVRANTWWHFNPTGDLDSVDVTRKSEASNYLEVDEGPTDCDKDGSYFDITTNSGKASFNSVDMVDSTREIFTLEIEAIVKEIGGDTSLKFYVDNGATEYDSSTIYITTTYAVKSAQWDTNPFTSNPWTKSDLDGLQFGIKNTGSNDLRVTRIFARAQYTLESDEEWGASEIFELTSSDNGVTWKMSRELSRNSGIGIPIMNNAHYLHNDRIHVIWTSGFDLFYFTDKRFGLVQFTGDDLRLVYAGAEIDRVLDYANKNETEILFQCQEEIPANCRAGPDDYYLYSGNPNEATAAESDPHEVYDRDFQNWEQCEIGYTLDGQDGWSVESGTALPYASPPNVSNKVGAGEQSALCSPSAGDFAMVKTIGSGLTNVQLDILFWMESSGGDDRAWAEFEDSGGNIFGAGLDNGDNRAAYKVDESWTNSDLYANYKSLNHLRLRVTSAGCSAWWNGDEIVLEYNDSDAITSVDKLRLCCNAITYFDFSRVGHSWATSGSGGVADPEVIVQSEEWQGFRIDATLLGRGSDSFIIDATIWGFKMGSVSAVTSTVAPTVVLGSTTATATVSVIVAAVDPTVIGGPVSLTPAAASMLATAADPTVVLGSTTATATVSMVVATSNPAVILGSTTVSPVACSIVTNVENPTVTLGSTMAAPDAVAIVAAASDSTVVLGSLQITPDTVVVIVGIVEPTIVLGSVTITATVSAVTSSSGPTVIYGSTTATPAATSLVTGRANPTTVLGSLTLTPSEVSLIISSFDPTVLYGSSVATPGSVSVVISTETATVVYGSVTATPDATALVTASANPEVIYGSIVITPNAVSLVTESASPTLRFGSTTATPSAISLITGAINPNVIGGLIDITPSAVSCVTSTSSPTIHYGSTTATATASAILASNDPGVTYGSLTLTSIASVIVSTGDPAVLFGSTVASPGAVSLITSSSDPQVVYGSLAITPAAVSCVSSTADPTVLFGSTSAAPAATNVVASVGEPTVAYGSLSISPTAIDANVGAVDPNVIIGAISLCPGAVAVITSAISPTIILGSVTVASAPSVAVIESVSPTVHSGSITAAPTAVSIRVSSVNPGVIIGAITISPSAVSAITAGSDPSVIYSSTTATPTASSVIATANDCAVHLGSTTQTPAATSVVVVAHTPTVIVGSVIIAPAAAITVISTSDPTTVLGSQAVAPAVVTSIVSVADPTVILGDISLTATTSAVLSTLAPTVVIGDVSVTPTAVSILCSTVAPSLVFSSTSASPAATTVVTSTVAPNVILSWITVSPAPLNVIVTGNDPAVALGALTLTPTSTSVIITALDSTIVIGSTTAIPSAIVAILSTLAPTVSYGSVAIEPTAVAAIATATEPAVVFGSTSVTPAAATAYTSAVDPTVALGSVTVQPTPVSIVLASESPVVTGGSITLSPTATSIVTGAVDPVVVQASLSIQPTSVSIRALTTGPSVYLGGITVSPEAVAVLAGVIDPSTVLGSTQVSPTSAVVYTSVGDPVLVLGSLSISPEALDAIAGTANPTVVFGALVISPTSSQAVTVAVSPDIILGSTVSVPNPVSAVADTLDPSVVLTGVVLTMPDGRSVIVGQDDRMFTVLAEDRGVLVQSEERMFIVSRDN